MGPTDRSDCFDDTKDLSNRVPVLKEVHIPPNHYRGIFVVQKDFLDCIGCQIIKGSHDIYR